MLISWALSLLCVVALFYLAINLIYMILMLGKTAGKKMSTILTTKRPQTKQKKLSKNASGITLDKDKPVRVYWNLNQKCWSIQQAGKVVAHMQELFLTDCEMIVQPAGNAKVKKEQRKNVHAFVKGKLADPCAGSVDTRISYSPYENAFFYVVKTGEKIERASCVKFTTDGKCFIPKLY